MQVTDDHIAKGFEHLETIAMVHYGKDSREYAEAISALSEFFGLDHSAQSYLIERVGDFVPDSRAAARSWVIIGFLIGMATAQHGIESI
jgi:hypothetical protein